MKKIPLISFTLLLMLAAAPCSAHKAPLPGPAAQSKKQNAMPQFTHAEVVQFIRTVQTQAMSWKETITSIEPSTLHLDDRTSKLVNDQKSQLFFYLGVIEKLRPDNGGKQQFRGLHQETIAASDSLITLAVEFWLFNDICEFKDGVSGLSNTLADDPNGQVDAARLLEIYKEAQTAKDTLFTEIMNRITTAGLHTVERSGQKTCKE
jgi:hypothetical protein